MLLLKILPLILVQDVALGFTVIPDPFLCVKQTKQQVFGRCSNSFVDRTTATTTSLSFYLADQEGELPAASRDSSSASIRSATDVESVLTPEQVEFFDQEGYLFLSGGGSGLLTDDVVENLVEAGDEIVQMAEASPHQEFSIVEKGILFAPPSTSSQAGSPDEATQEGEGGGTNSQNNIIVPFRNTALRSKLAQACSELMHLDPSAGNNNLRILRDVFLAKPIETSSNCDWHVDDQEFWPQSFLDESGINVWIAMDDMPYEGSMAVVPKSHQAGWRHDAYRAIGQDRSQEGSSSKQEIVELFQQGIESMNTTCAMGFSDPELQSKIEASKVTFNVKRGDIIFASRLLFHRTLPVTDEGKEYYKSVGKKTLNRYSVRYVPGSVHLPAQYNLELSLVANPANRGRTLDQVAEHDGGIWYPQVWPQLEEYMDQRLDSFAQDRLPAAKEAFQIEREELLRAIREGAKP